MTPRERLPVTYHEHVSEFTGLGRGFTPQAPVNHAVYGAVVMDIVEHGETRDPRTRVLATCIRDSIDNSN